MRSITRIGTVGAIWAAALALGAATARECRADDAPPDRVTRLEAALQRQAAETERLRKDFETYKAEHPDASRLTEDETRAAVDAYLSTGPVPTLALAPSSGGGVRWGGYANVQFLAPSNENSHFDVNRLILALDASVTDRIDFRAEFEFEHGGISDELDGEIVIEQAEFVFHACDAFNPKVGAILIPFGRYNLYHDDPINDFTVRPFTARFLVPTGFAQPGIGLEGSMPFGCGHVFSYDLALTNGYRDDFTADEGVRECRQFWDADENEGKQLWGRGAVVWKACGVDYLETGVSATWAKYDAADRNDLLGFAVDVLARFGPWEVKGEYVAYDYERNSDDPPDAIRGQSGLWVEGAYHFFPAFWCGCRSPFLRDTSLFTLAARYQHMDLDDRVSGATFEDDLDAWSVGLNLRITERSVFRIDHTWFEAESGESRTELAASFSTYF